MDKNHKIALQDLTDLVAAQTGATKKLSEAFLRELSEVIQEYLERDGVVKVKGLGTFKLVWNEERKSVNVSTGDTIVLPAHYKVVFTPDQVLKEQVNAPYAHLGTVIAEPPSDKTQASPQPQTTIEPAIQVGSEPELEQEPAPTPVPEPEPQPQSESQQVRIEKTPVARKKHLWLWIIIVLLLLAVAVYALWMYCPSFKQYNQKLLERWYPTEAVMDSIDVVTLELDTVAVVDSLSDSVQWVGETPYEPFPDSTYGENLASEITMQAPEPEYTPELAQNAPALYYEEVRPGSRLAQMARRAYGHKSFWVYIYDANRDKLKTPGSVKQGMKLKIPDLGSSYVNAADSACVRRAEALELLY